MSTEAVPDNADLIAKINQILEAGTPVQFAEVAKISWETFAERVKALTGCEITFEVWLGQKNLSFRAIRHRHLNDQVRELAEWQIKTPAEQAAILALGVWQTESAIYYVDPEQMLGTATVKPDPDSLFTVPEVEYDIANYCGDLLAAMFDADLMGETPNPEVAIAMAARSEIFTVSEPNYAQFVEAILQVANQAQVELKGIIWRGEYNPEIDQTDFLITFTSPDWSKVNLTFRWKAAGDKNARTVTINTASNNIGEAAGEIVRYFEKGDWQSIGYAHMIETSPSPEN